MMHANWNSKVQVALAFSLAVTTSVLAAGPDLAPYQPLGWGGPMIVSASPGIRTNGGTIHACRVAYLSVAVQNVGSVSSGPFYVDVWDDATGERLYRGRAGALGPISQGYYMPFPDVEIVFTQAGPHALRMVIDVDNEVAEDDEQNNSHRLDVAVSVGDCWPDLVLYQPDGWASALVVSATTGTNEDGTVYACQPAYIDFAVKNIGFIGTEGGFAVEVHDETTSEVLYRGLGGALDPALKGYSMPFEDCEIVFTRPGRHDLLLIVDVDQEVAEGNEQNNSYPRTVYVYDGDCRADLVPCRPDGWQDTLVVYAAPSPSGDAMADEAVWPFRDAYLAYTIENAGYTPAGQFVVTIADLTEGTSKSDTWDVLPTGSASSMFNIGWQFTTAGYHIVQIQIDPNDEIAESDESNNTYERIVHVGDNIVDRCEIEGASNRPYSSVPLYVNDYTIYPIENCTTCEDGICVATAIADILAYWDRTPYQGITYWNLVDHGKAPLRDPPTEVDTDPGDVKTLIQMLGTYHYVEPHPTVPALNYEDRVMQEGVRHVANTLNGLAFDVSLYVDADASEDPANCWTSDQLFEKVCAEIRGGRPVLWTVPRHAAPIIGYADLNDYLDQVFVHVNTYRQADRSDRGVRSEYICWDGPEKDWETHSIITVEPNGLPVDDYEPDDGPSAASVLDPNHPFHRRQTHNVDRPGDVDWVRFDAAAGHEYVIVAKNFGPAADPRLYLYGPDGRTRRLGPDSAMTWTCEQSGTYFIQAVHGNVSASGHDTNYDLEVTDTSAGETDPAVTNDPTHAVP